MLKETSAALIQAGYNTPEELEWYISGCNKAYEQGKPIIEDSVWDALIKLLRSVKPSSNLLVGNYGTDESKTIDDDLLIAPMLSIKTASTWAETSEFVRSVEEFGGEVALHASYKMNGHGIRIIYKNGKLFRAYTRGRTGKGRDITRHIELCRNVPNYVERWKEIDIVGVRGEALVTDKDFREELSEKWKHRLSSVTHLMAESNSDEEVERYLRVLAYRFIEKGGKTNSLTGEYRELREAGFETPPELKIKVNRSDVVDQLNKLVIAFTQIESDGKVGYDTDGVVVRIDNDRLYDSCEIKDDHHSNGGIALKLGKRWQTGFFKSVIERVQWEPGKKYVVPKALIEPVVMPNGATVTVVPLYNVGVMKKYSYYSGQEIYFGFGSEHGVVCLDEDGERVTSE
jgi:NAD-dependent DNA ligase